MGVMDLNTVVLSGMVATWLAPIDMGAAALSVDGVVGLDVDGDVLTVTVPLDVWPVGDVETGGRVWCAAKVVPMGSRYGADVRIVALHVDYREEG